MEFLKCPICGARFEIALTPAMPFCSDRCRQIDLGRWFGEEYSLPCVPDEDEQEQAAEEDYHRSDRN